MKKEITVVGGNIAGLSAAYHLARRGFKVRVYERQIWNKPCGGAISREFAAYLKHELGVVPWGVDHFVPTLRFAFRNSRSFDMENFFVVTRREELQQKLVERLQADPDIDIVFKRVSISDTGLFTPQTIVASGFSGFTRRVMQTHWHQLVHGMTFRFDGHVQKGRHPDKHLMVFDSRIKGYGWVFIGKDDHINIGLGGMTDRTLVRQWYAKFFDYIADYHGYHIRPDHSVSAGWKIPVFFKNWAHPVSFAKNGIEFIGAGDVLGLPHPIIGAGIEPAWQSGWVLAHCADPETGIIDARRYTRLLKQNLELTCRKPIDRAVTAIIKSHIVPSKDAGGYLAARFITPYMVKMIKKYPWYALVHDGNRKTGYRAPAFD